MKMKMELKYLKNYLGTGLKCTVNSNMYPDPILTGMNGIFAYFNYHGAYLSFEMSRIKPLLLPLSALTEPMEYGSVPIVELSKLRDSSFRIGEFGYSEDDGYFITNGLYHKFGFKNNAFYVYYDNGTMFDGFCEINNQLQLFEYLFANHFDVWNLIENNLASDKRKLNINS